MTESSVKLLQWDSQFFNKKIGYLNRINELCEEDCKDFDLITCKVDTADYRGVDFLSNNRFSLVEAEVKFCKNIVEQEVSPVTKSLDYADSSHLDELIALAGTSYQFSRFRTPWFDEKQKELFYSEWVKNAVLGQFDDCCIILKDGNNISGFVSVKKTEKEVSIGLIAVSRTYQGKGIATQLLELVEQYAVSHNCCRILVSTQLSNIPRFKSLFKKWLFNIEQ